MIASIVSSGLQDGRLSTYGKSSKFLPDALYAPPPSSMNRMRSAKEMSVHLAMRKTSDWYSVSQARLQSGILTRNSPIFASRHGYSALLCPPLPNAASHQTIAVLPHPHRTSIAYPQPVVAHSGIPEPARLILFAHWHGCLVSRACPSRSHPPRRSCEPAGSLSIVTLRLLRVVI